MTTDLKIPGWSRVAVGAVSAVIVGVVATQTYFDSRFVAKSEHEAHEKADKEEVARIDRALVSHMDNTRLDSTRLSVIEAQLATIQRQLDRMDGKLDKAARVPR